MLRRRSNLNINSIISYLTVSWSAFRIHNSRQNWNLIVIRQPNHDGNHGNDVMLHCFHENIHVMTDYLLICIVKTSLVLSHKTIG